MEIDLLLEFITKSVKEINSDIEKLNSNKINDKKHVFNHLCNEAMILENYVNYLNHKNRNKAQQKTVKNQNTFKQKVKPVVNGTDTFTLDELAKFDGKNGNPAYVAISGVVYDVTNNAAWETAKHFGFSAGKDLTTRFASCHTGAKILSSLPIVGKLISN